MRDPADLSQWQLQHLEAELARIDVRIRREVRRWVLAGQDPNDDYRGLYITQAEAVALLDLPFGVSWGQSIPLPPEEEETFQHIADLATKHAEDVAHQLRQLGGIPRLYQLAAAFGLDRMALDMLLLCLAPAFATRYERLYGYLQDNVTRRRPTVRLLLDLLGEPGMQQFALAGYLSQEAPLIKHRLLEFITEAPPANFHWINQTLQVEEGVVAWLRGEYQAHLLLGEHTSLQRHPVGSLIATDLSRGGLGEGSIQDEGAGCAAPIWVFYGVDGDRQVNAAQEIADEAGKALLTVYLTKIINEACPALQAIRLALRDARLTGAIPFLRGWDVCLTSEETVEPLLLQMLCDYPDLVIVAGQRPWQAVGVTRQRPFFQQAFPLPDAATRLALWQHFLHVETERRQRPRLDPAVSASLSEVAGQFVLSSGQIRDAVALACDRTGQEARSLGLADLFAAARTCSQARLGTLASKIEPRYEWSDLILPQDQIAILHELVDTVRGRAKVLGEWGLDKKLAASKGVAVLFSGPPGTGKTMAAEVIARVLGYDLYKIDLSSIVSKYIGETEKNLERIFSEATSSNAILFFDEADALFGKRSEVKDAHDRFANIEISYLLQRMERYDGVAILATNLKAHLDEAFTRRLQFIVAFPFPQRHERYLIWQTLFPVGVPRAGNLDEEFKRLAERFELTGANIRNILYSAVNLAASNGQVVTKEHLRHGVKRELQKMGKTVNAGDLS